jgi:D-glycero-D-manno-heptose 1,7-bisphosphate phosphatase
VTKVVFLDRDGTINAEVNYLSRVEDFRMLPGAAQAIALLRAHGWLAIIVSNQSGIGRGFYTVQDLAQIDERMRRELADAGTAVDSIYYCPHRPDEGCACRKPASGLFRQAAEEYDIDLKSSYLVGDKLSDLLPARELGCRSVLVLTGHGMEHFKHLGDHDFRPDYVALDLYEAAQWIVQQPTY